MQEKARLGSRPEPSVRRASPRRPYWASPVLLLHELPPSSRGFMPLVRPRPPPWVRATSQLLLLRRVVALSRWGLPRPAGLRPRWTASRCRLRRSRELWPHWSNSIRDPRREMPSAVLRRLPQLARERRLCSPKRPAESGPRTPSYSRWSLRSARAQVVSARPCRGRPRRGRCRAGSLRTSRLQRPPPPPRRRTKTRRPIRTTGRTRWRAWTCAIG